MSSECEWHGCDLVPPDNDTDDWQAYYCPECRLTGERNLLLNEFAVLIYKLDRLRPELSIDVRDALESAESFMDFYGYNEDDE